MSLSLLKTTGRGDNLSTSNFSNLPIFTLSTSVFNLAKSSFLYNFDVLTPVVFFKVSFVA